ncbi:hypothetical protein [Anaerosolibacter sp.]|uniref:hypothetical protein n=1 Tax=Anaerosolibacter sp. TaxID=1872527 RepID=UPI0039F0AE7B
MRVSRRQTAKVATQEVSRLVDLSNQVFQKIINETRSSHQNKETTKSQEVHFVMGVLNDLANRSYPQ